MMDGWRIENGWVDGCVLVDEGMGSYRLIDEQKDT
jgi:hypothetical protein